MLEAFRCTNCLYESVVQTLFCPKCRAQQFEKFSLPREGKVYSFTTVYVPPPEYKNFAPYRVALIQLTENLRLTAFIQEEIMIGDQVQFKEKHEETYIFEKM